MKSDFDTSRSYPEDRAYEAEINHKSEVGSNRTGNRHTRRKEVTSTDEGHRVTNGGNENTDVIVTSGRQIEPSDNLRVSAEAESSGWTRKHSLDVPQNISASGPTTRGNSVSLSSFSSGPTNSSSCRAQQMKVIYYQNRFIAVPLPSSVKRHPSISVTSCDSKNELTSLPVCGGDVTAAAAATQYHQSYNNQAVDRISRVDADPRQGSSQKLGRKSYLLMRFIDLLHDEDKRPAAQTTTTTTKKTKTGSGSLSPLTAALVKCFNLFFLTMGILLLIGVLTAIAFSSIAQWLYDPDGGKHLPDAATQP